MDPAFTRTVPSDEVPSGACEAVVVGGAQVLLRRLADGTVVAFEAACPHQGQPLSDGVVTGWTLECARHLYAYDLRSGRNTFPGDERDPALVVYATVEREGWVWVGPPRSQPG